MKTSFFFCISVGEFLDFGKIPFSDVEFTSSSGGGPNAKIIVQRSYMTTGRYTELLRYLLPGIYTAVMATRGES